MRNLLLKIVFDCKQKNKTQMMLKMMMNCIFLLLTCFVSSVLSKKKPHILFLVIDDLGWSDHSINENTTTDIPTPYLRKMADDGVRLGNYYTQTVCSPTRSSLMTGMFPFRIGMQHSTTLTPGTTAHIPLNVPTLPEMLKTQGYETHMIGKWHLGYSKWKYTPTGRGFDSFYGYLQGQEDYYNKTVGLKGFEGYDFWHNQTVDRSVIGGYSLDQYMSHFESLLGNYNMKSLREKEEKPLFLYFSHQTVHVPLEPHRNETRCDSIENQWRRYYCSMIVELDDAVGKTVKLLDDHEMLDDTLIFMTTDNGGMVLFGTQDDGTPLWPASVGANFPYRGSKSTLFEGGVKGTAFIWGGKNIMDQKVRGSTFHGLLHAVDYFTMALSIASSSNNNLLDKVDGKDLLGPILNYNFKSTASRFDIPININYGGNKYTAIRFGDWKLLIGSPILIGGDGWYPIGAGDPEPAPEKTKNKYQLFNIKNDPFEKQDIASDNMDKVQLGKNLIQKYLATGYRKPQFNIPHLSSFPQLHDGVWAPFEWFVSEEM